MLRGSTAAASFIVVKERRNMKQGCIFLIGLMGSGKTTVGRTLASRLNAVFTDTDEMIEAQARIMEPVFERMMTEMKDNVQH